MTSAIAVAPVATIFERPPSNWHPFGRRTFACANFHIGKMCCKQRWLKGRVSGRGGVGSRQGARKGGEVAG